MNWNIIEKLEPLYTGDKLKSHFLSLPDYHDSIRETDQMIRLMKLNDIYSFYLPSKMSTEIYTKTYLAMIHSMKKKESIFSIKQKNINGQNIIAASQNKTTSFQGIIGGGDSFSIIGTSGIGKTTAISKSVSILKGETIIEMKNPYCKIIPIINVQCPFDCSSKSMLLEILQKIDILLGTSYYEKMVKTKANTNTMLISTAQILLNHVAILCIDEVQNLIKHKGGNQLVSMLTELLNESGIGIIFVGTPEIRPFFESADYLARRTLGLYYENCEFDFYFKNFCIQLWKYQYVKEQTMITDNIIYWFYQHSAGILSNVMFLFKTAQEISILNGHEKIDLIVLEEAFQQMRMLHDYIPEQNIPIIQKKKKTKLKESKDCKEWTFTELAKKAKKEQKDIISLLKNIVSIVEVNI